MPQSIVSPPLLILSALLLLPGVEGVDTNWSGAVDGIRGRLIATATQDPGADRPQFRLELELQNVDTVANPIEIWWTGLSSMLELTLEDESGTPVPQTLRPAGNEMIPSPEWLPLLFQSTVKLVVARAGYEYQGSGRAWLRPMQWVAWDVASLPPGRRLFIRGTLTPKAAPQPRQREWRRSLALPRVEIPTAAQQPDDDPFIALAKQADVSALDTTLAKQRFEDWFRAVVGPQAKISWGRTDCGEATGSPSDRNRDLPTCAEPTAELPDGRKVVLEMAVGSRQRGISRTPSGFYAIAILENGGSKVTQFKSLSELASALRR
jgi:hypothetical protein